MGLSENIIKSLDKDELRFISRDVLADQESQAAKLFDLIGEFGDEEEKIAARFKRAAPKGNLSVVRNQLQHILLKSIEQRHADDYIFAGVNSLLLQIRIFADRSAFDIVKKLLDKALQTAEENELFTQWLELLEIKLHLYQTKNYLEDDKAADILSMSKVVFARYANHQAYRWLLFEQMLLMNNNFILRTEEDKDKWEQIRQHELLSDIAQALSKKARIEYWIIQAQYYNIFKQYDDAQRCFQELVTLFEENPFLKQIRCMDFLWANSQLAQISYFTKDTASMHQALEAIKAAKKHNDIEQVAAFTYYTNYGMAYYDLINDKPSLKQLLDEAHAGLRTWIARIKPDGRIALLVSCVSVWVEWGEYEKALAIIREFSDYIYTENRLDGKIVLLFYELIAQIESGNELMVNDTLQNFNRYLLRHNFKSEFEQLMVRFLKVISSHTPTVKEELSALKEQLLVLPERSILDQHRVLYQILMSMIDSRLSGTRYHDYIAAAKK
ncbi:MAG: hypothetical protein JWO03_164 [Bacteroidetes bacterium]|nr:hypothetical protein [Bacteroidota bacterium]